MFSEIFIFPISYSSLLTQIMRHSADIIDQNKIAQILQSYFGSTTSVHFLVHDQWIYCYEVNLQSNYIQSSNKPFPKQALIFTFVSTVTAFENTMGNGEIARNEQFLLFPQCFLLFWRTFCHFHQIQNCRLFILSVCKSLTFVVWERVK